MTALRSFLFIPGDPEKNLSKTNASGPDGLILDLEQARNLVTVQPDQNKELFERFRPLIKHETDVILNIATLAGQA